MDTVLKITEANFLGYFCAGNFKRIANSRGSVVLLLNYLINLTPSLRRIEYLLVNSLLRLISALEKETAWSSEMRFCRTLF